MQYYKPHNAEGSKQCWMKKGKWAKTDGFRDREQGISLASFIFI
jgi:hypothetical protein